MGACTCNCVTLPGYHRDRISLHVRTVDGYQSQADRSTINVCVCVRAREREIKREG